MVTVEIKPKKKNVTLETDMGGKNHGFYVCLGCIIQNKLWGSQVH